MTVYPDKQEWAHVCSLARDLVKNQAFVVKPRQAPNDILDRDLLPGVLLPRRKLVDDIADCIEAVAAGQDLLQAGKDREREGAG